MYHAQAKLPSHVLCSVCHCATQIKRARYYWMSVYTAVFDFTEPLSVVPLPLPVPLTMTTIGQGEWQHKSSDSDWHQFMKMHMQDHITSVYCSMANTVEHQTGHSNELAATGPSENQSNKGAEKTSLVSKARSKVQLLKSLHLEPVMCLTCQWHNKCQVMFIAVCKIPFLFVFY